MASQISTGQSKNFDRELEAIKKKQMEIIL